MKGGKMEDWKRQLQSGVFTQFEVFDASWTEESFPAVYAAINKLWGYGPEGYVERTDIGAENNVTVAIHREIVLDRMNMSRVESYTKQLAGMTSAFYGFIELGVQWDRPMLPDQPDGLRGDLIDVRWHERGWNDYRNGMYRMEEMIPRLYWTNLLRGAHFRDGGPDALPERLVERVEEWDGDRFYVRFVRDPQADDRFAWEIAPYFNLLPEDTDEDDV